MVICRMSWRMTRKTQLVTTTTGGGFGGRESRMCVPHDGHLRLTWYSAKYIRCKRNKYRDWNFNTPKRIVAAREYKYWCMANINVGFGGFKVHRGILLGERVRRNAPYVLWAFPIPKERTANPIQSRTEHRFAQCSNFYHHLCSALRDCFPTPHSIPAHCDGAPWFLYSSHHLGL